MVAVQGREAEALVQEAIDIERLLFDVPQE